MTHETDGLLTHKAGDIADILFVAVERILGRCDMTLWLADLRPDAGSGAGVDILRCVRGRTADGTVRRVRSLRNDPTTLEWVAWQAGTFRYDDGQGSGTRTSRLALPLCDDAKKVIGMLSVCKGVPSAFTWDEIEFLRQAAGLTTGAVLLHRVMLVTQLVALMEEAWLKQLFTSGVTDTGGEVALRQAERQFFADSLQDVMVCLRAITGQVAVVEDGRLQLLAPATTPLAFGPGAMTVLSDDMVSCMACRTRDLFVTDAAEFPDVCFAVPVRHNGTVQAVYFLFDNEEERLSFARVQEFADKISVVAQTITLAREWVRQTSLQRAVSALGVLGTMLINAHHDLRGPLSRVLAFLQNWPIKSRTPDYYDPVRRNAERSLAAIDKLIFFLEDSRTPKRVLITGCVNDAKQRIIGDRREHAPGPVIRFAADHDERAAVLGLEEQLTGVFEHLFRNGLRYTSHLKDAGYVQVAATPSGPKSLRIVVQDNGKGMTEEVCQQIFRPFYKIHSDGTGLGLPAVYAVVKYHGGDIRVSSTPDVGTTFTITLPTC